MMEPLEPAVLDWNEHGLPVSRRYGDVYFSTDGGLDEARHVFLAGNDLAARLAVARCFTIGETGFGSGLNFLALWQLWREVAPPDARLRFFSVEKHPLEPEDMARIHALFPEIAPYAEELRANLPLPVPGFHRVWLAAGRIQLTLMYGDALAMLHEQEAQADAWFLDGFAPRLNPELWSMELARELGRLSAPGATVATFSTSTSTQEAMAQAGFTIGKRPGFGRKKHMLTGRLPEGRVSPAIPPSQVTVIGGGLAGAAAAHALARRGTTVTLWERAPQVAAGASANPSAIFYPAVTVGWQPQALFYFAGYSYSLHLLSGLDVPRGQGGMLLFPKPHEDPLRQCRVMEALRPHSSVLRQVDAAEASVLAGIPLRQGALYFPQNGWVDIGAWVRALLAHSRIEVRAGQAGVPSGTTLLCNGWEAQETHPALKGTMHTMRGQISCLPTVPALQGLRCVLSYGGYLTPAIDGVHHCGATYGRDRPDTAYDAADDTENRAKLRAFIGQEVPEAAGGWAALRSVSRDRLPLLGKVEDGLYANLAHASRGLLSCALSGEYLASLLHGDPLPLPRSVAARLHPLRFS